jgi:uncharacterized protein (DUF1501 family)
MDKTMRPEKTSWPDRRQMLAQASLGFGAVALAAIGSPPVAAATARRVTRTHHQPRAKRVIFLFMQGGQSQMDLFDPKPELRRRDGQLLNSSKDKKYKGSPFRFLRHGQSGLELCELLPRMAAHADDLCVVRSMFTDSPNHSNAMLCFHTGSQNFVRPSMGSWVYYGLGAESENLPGFVAIRPSRAHGARMYSSAFLPAQYQGVAVGHDGVPARKVTIRDLTSAHWSAEQRTLQLAWLREQNRAAVARGLASPEVEGFIQNYELAARMQLQAPDLLDLSQEPRAIQDLYGIDDKATDEMGRMCLMARRFAEAGVRFIQVNHNGWDHHGSIDKGIRGACQRVDRPIGALIQDLKQRGMLHDTLIVSSGEFGRTATAEGEGDRAGRGHNAKGFSIWMCGGGVRGGQAYGATDELGITAVEKRAHIHDLHATMLHLLGLDHQRLTYRYSGRDFRLTDVYGRVLDGVTA